MTKGRESILGRKSEGKTFEKHSVKFMYSEKAAKFCGLLRIYELYKNIFAQCSAV